MQDTGLSIGYSDGDVDTNHSNNPSLESLVQQRYSRRQTLFGGGSAAAMAVFGSGLLAACGSDDEGSPTNGGAVAVGGDIRSNAGRIVTLTGTVSSMESGLTATWVQLSGPAVTLNNANTTTATFTAPSVSAATPLVFRFSAENPQGSVRGAADATVTIDPATLGFTAVSKSLDDVVAVPAGYTVTVLYRLGDPLLSGAGAYANNGTDTNFAARAGDHHDGMSYFGLGAGGGRDDSNSTRGLLVMNHENINQQYLHPAGATSQGGVRPEAEAIKEIECHGVSVVEISRSGATWAYVPAGALNRRITPLTPTTYSGPVRGSALLRTVYSKDGTAGRGTINNCANGYMPWGTYLTNEENWAGYFRRDATDTARRTAREVVALARYGLSVRAGNYGWATVVPADSSNTSFAKWNLTINPAAPADGTGDFRYEANQFGWVVEIDPYDPTIAPRKRTALGRMNHEGCWPGRTVAGTRPAFYMGDDAQNEYIYKFVSATPWAAADATAANRIAIGDKYLDAGTLHVARFNADGTGTWLPLVFGQGPLTPGNATYAFADQADVLTHCRLARRRARRDADGPAGMDRDQSGHRRDVLHADQQYVADHSQHRSRQSPRLYRPQAAAGRSGQRRSAVPARAHQRQRERPHHPTARDGRHHRGDRLRLGRLCVRRGCGSRPCQHQPFRARRHQRFLPAPTGSGSHGRRASRARSIRCCGSKPTTAPTPTSPTACCSPRCPARSATARPG